MGSQRSRLIANHEAAHALVAYALGWKVVSVVVSDASGKTTYVVPHDRSSSDVLWGDLAVKMSGMAAERRLRGRLSREGASSDFDEAAKIAAELGGMAAAGKGMPYPSSWGLVVQTVFPAAYMRDCGIAPGTFAATAINTATSYALAVLRRHRRAYQALVEELLHRQRLEGEDLAQLLAR